jgi:hypothetical protein
MKSTHSIREVQLSGAQGTNSTFTIRSSAKAFKILSSGLYSDKIKAIVREIGCNAYDAHVLAGHPEKPFDVMIPDSTEPTFSVRDYGPGLSHEEMCGKETTQVDPETGEEVTMLAGGLYNTYFESSKTDSNDYIGALGLGSKSPFSYKDTFTVTSWHDGHKRIYTAFINKHGQPDIQLMHQDVSDEPSGLQVDVAVDPVDFRRFSTTASDVFQYFAVTPNIISTYRDKTEYQQFAKGDGWMFGLDWNGQRASTLVRQGNVTYPLDLSAIPQSIEGHKGVLAKIAGLVIDFPIGELDVAPSREALSYDPATCEAIIKRLEQLRGELHDRAQELIKGCESEWDATIAAMAPRSLCSDGETTVDALLSHWIENVMSVSDFMWNGKKLNESRQLESTEHMTIVTLSKTALGTVRATTTPLGTTVSAGRGHRARSIKYDQVTPSPTTQVVYSDIKSGTIRRVRNMMQSKHVNLCYIISPNNISEKNNPEYLQDVLRQFGNPSHISASTLPTVKNDSTRREPSSIYDVRRMTKRSSRRNGWHHKWEDNWPRAPHDFSEGGLYITTQELPYVDSQIDGIGDHTFKNMMCDLIHHEIIGEVYGLTPRTQKFKQKYDGPHWVEAGKAMKHALRKIITPELLQDLVQHDVRVCLSRDIDSFRLLTDTAKKQLGKDWKFSPLLDYELLINRWNSFDDDIKWTKYKFSYEFIENAITLLGLELPEHPDRKLIEEFKTRYPLIEAIYPDQADEQMLIDYIQMVDGTLKEKDDE